ncbi:hypothetical protein BWI93_06475 [Siphonobacter sp. BAB-5385]|uniref:hypothetical protein n=1 Tax=unclassified Siphonobacter TaxID=2635712 RepID=UPI000B9E4913|nr:MULTISPECIES: hypothetical protein [unclassified Siphonobacter]OZI08875.1 hypothetical protein BWI93_06475 [Siphonobacter sp. BAB-5385]PMD96681.1 hypothetical protein BWI97_10945 [Siphonobacter sp. BAB-5405]
MESTNDTNNSWSKMKQWWRISSLIRWAVLIVVVLMVVAIGGSLIFIKDKKRTMFPGTVASDTIRGDTLFEPTKTIHLPAKEERDTN